MEKKELWTEEIPRYFFLKATAPQRRLGWFYWHRLVDTPLHLPTEDWDTCVVLDACRFDLFKSLNIRKGELESRIAPGSQTGAFLQANFPSGSEYGDIVYVNGNPRLATIDIGEFHDIIHVWENEWDEEYRTVLPSSMRKAAIEAHRDYPNKRVLIHFIQPHIPFIGETSTKMPNGASIQDNVDSIEEREKKPYEAAASGDISPDIPRKAYGESLSLVLKEVYHLIDSVDGKIVVTADHGELLGERIASLFGNPPNNFSRWGHPPDTPLKPLVKVPWWIPPYESRRATTKDNIEVSEEADPRKKQLEALGYK